MLLAPLTMVRAVHADDTNARRDPEFRLLEIGGRKVRWAMPKDGLPPRITYAFLAAPAQFPGARNCDAMLPPEAALAPSRIGIEDFRREVRAAFDTWSQAANVEFVETSSIASAGILIGSDAKARGRAFTNVALRQDQQAGDRPALGTIQQSLICLNPQRPWKIGFDGNLDIYDVRFTITHEIGHAIGLDHPGPEGQLMSFRYVEKGRDLKAGDVAGAVALYGAKGLSAPHQGLIGTTPASRAEGPRVRDDREFGLGEPAPAGH